MDWWDTYEKREKLIFGEIDELSDLVDLSQFMQAEGMRYAIESHRRRSFSAAPARIAEGELVTFARQKNIGSIMWQINEPWPNVGCTCMVDYYNNPKLVFDFYSNAQKPLHASLRYDKLVWKPGESFDGYVFVNDDLCEGYDSVSVTTSVTDCETEGNKISFKVPECDSFTVTVSLRRGNYVDTTTYIFLVGEMGSIAKEPILDYVKAYRKELK